MRRYDERGLALASPIAILSAVAVVLAGAAFLVTSRPTDPPVKAATPVTATPTASPTPTETQPVVRPKKAKKVEKAEKKPLVRRSGTYVEVYNNSGISGLAGATASKISGAGWEVVGSDNWYGTIPQSTVYYPDRLEDEARLLARDLGIERLRPAIAPMRFDRLTVILTSGYS